MNRVSLAFMFLFHIVTTTIIIGVMKGMTPSWTLEGLGYAALYAILSIVFLDRTKKV